MLRYIREYSHEEDPLLQSRYNGFVALDLRFREPCLHGNTTALVKVCFASVGGAAELEQGFKG